MRKDVKLGMSVGAILFTVIVVYLIVAGGNKHKNNPGAPLADADSPAGQVGDTGDAPKSDVPAVDHTTARSDTPANNTQAAANGAPVADGQQPPADWRGIMSGQVPVPAQAAVTVQPDPRATDPGPGIHESVGADRPDNEGHGTMMMARDSAPVTVTTTQPAALASTGSRTHVVKEGENFWSIARNCYGNGAYAARIQEANPTVNPNRMHAGQTLVIPEVQARSSDSRVARGTAGGAIAEAEPRAVDGRSEYRVKGGDSLYAISVRLYGKADRLEKIYELNKDAIGPDKARLKLGMVLKLPEAPAMTAQR